MNCASFIRIRSIHIKSKRHEDNLDPLDDTRIHPEDYELARKMAVDCVDEDFDDDEDNFNSQVKDLFQRDKYFKMEKLNALDLESFSVELENKSKIPKRRTLIDIKDELIQ